MKAVILGCAGAMGVHASTELAACGRFDDILLADLDLAKASELARTLGMPDKAVVALDARDPSALEALMPGAHDIVVNALPRPFALGVARAVIAAGTRAIDLSDISPELRALDADARAAGALYVAGCGSSSGLTNMMAKHGARGMAEVISVEISFASFRAISLSPASIDGVFWEFGPHVARGYYDQGVYHHVPLWDSPKEVEFARPIGRQTVTIVPQSEAHTLPRTLRARRVVVRGTFTPKTMLLMRALVQFGAFEPEPVTIRLGPTSDAARTLSRREFFKQYLMQVPEALDEPVWGYGLHVEVEGTVSGRRLKRTLWTSHPGPEQPGWQGPDAWARCVALPMVAGALLLSNCDAGSGIDAPEAFLRTEPFLRELAARGLAVHEMEDECAS